MEQLPTLQEWGMRVVEVEGTVDGAGRPIYKQAAVVEVLCGLLAQRSHSGGTLAEAERGPTADN